jgi:CrcB protein
VIWLYVAIGGAAGAVSRAAIGMWAMRIGGGFPWWTLLVNASGSFLLGLLMVLLPAPETGSGMRPLLALGFCGSFTTFSTFGYETVALWEAGAAPAAAAYVAASVGLGVAGVLTGLWVGGLAAG